MPPRNRASCAMAQCESLRRRPQHAQALSIIIMIIISIIVIIIMIIIIIIIYSLLVQLAFTVILDDIYIYI